MMLVHYFCNISKGQITGGERVELKVLWNCVRFEGLFRE